MAYLSSSLNISGTYGNIVVYAVGNRLYARTRSSLTGNRFKSDQAFAKSREKAKQFGVAVRIAKAFYNGLPKEFKRKGLFGKLTGLVQSGLQSKRCKTKIISELFTYLGIVPPTKTTKIVTQNTLKKRPGAFPVKPMHINNSSFSSWHVTLTGCLVKICNKCYGTFIKDVLIISSSP